MEHRASVHADELQEMDLVSWKGTLVQITYVHMDDQGQTVYWTGWDLWNERQLVLPPVHYSYYLDIWGI